MACLRNPLASAWVQLWEALFATPEQVRQVQGTIMRSQALRELEAAEENLRVVEAKLERQTEALLGEARDRKLRGDIPGARKKLAEKRNVVLQLERLRASQHVICMHLGTMQGAELNQTLMATLKASSQVIQTLAPNRNLREVEDIMFQLESDMRSASEINDALAKPIISMDGIGMDVSNTMNMEYTELEQELQHLLHDDLHGHQENAGQAKDHAVFTAGRSGVPASPAPLQPHQAESLQGGFRIIPSILTESQMAQ